MSECLALVFSPRRRRRICGAKAVGHIAPGVGRCVYHLSMHDRETRAVAARKAIRDMYELRGVDPDENARGDEQNAAEREPAFVDDDGTVWHWDASAE